MGVPNYLTYYTNHFVLDGKWLRSFYMLQVTETDEGVTIRVLGSPLDRCTTDEGLTVAVTDIPPLVGPSVATALRLALSSNTPNYWTSLATRPETAAGMVGYGELVQKEYDSYDGTTAAYFWGDYGYRNVPSCVEGDICAVETPDVLVRECPPTPSFPQGVVLAVYVGLGDGRVVTSESGPNPDLDADISWWRFAPKDVAAKAFSECRELGVAIAPFKHPWGDI